MLSDLRGIDSHGIARLRSYVGMLSVGRINPKPNISIVRESLSTAAVDGDNGLGLVVGPWANAIAMDKADQASTILHLTQLEGGLIGFTLRQLLLDLTDSRSLFELDRLVDRLIESYGFPLDWVPPRLLVREALAHTVQRHRIIERLQREFGELRRCVQR